MTTTVNDIQREVREFIGQNFIVDASPEVLGGDASLTRSGVLDSMGVLELIMFIEQRYAIKIPDQDAVPDNLDSVERAAGYVARRLDPT